MIIRLANYYNKSILVCIPLLFDDQQPRCFKLVGIEECGLWLESEELAEISQQPEETRSPEGAITVFFPFSHIAYVMPEGHPLSASASPLFLISPKESKRLPEEKLSKTKQRKRHPGIHRKGKK